MMNKMKILVAYHKEDCMPREDVFLPIQVGKAISSTNLGIQGDDDGENISTKNPYYCELTAMYWAWKNLKGVDIIGLCHYRRYFDFHHQCRPVFSYTSFSSDDFYNLDFSVNNQIIKRVKDGGIVVARAESLRCTLRQNYCEFHISEDIRTLESILNKIWDEKYKQSYYKVVEYGYKIHPYNMFLMRWEDFDAYCKWLFPLLEQVEQSIDISSHSTYQKRIYGFMAERLLNVWLDAEKKYVIESPVILIKENNLQNNKIGPRKLFREIRRNAYCRIINNLYKRTHDYL